MAAQPSLPTASRDQQEPSPVAPEPSPVAPEPSPVAPEPSPVAPRVGAGAVEGHPTSPSGGLVRRPSMVGGGGR